MTRLVDQPWRILFVVVGAGMIFFAFRLFWDPIRAEMLRKRFRRQAIQTTGTVVAHHVEYHDSDGTPSPIYYGIVEFRTRDGKVTQGQSLQGTGPATVHAGETVAMYYDPADPSKVDIISAATARTSGCAYGCSMFMSVPLLLFGLLLLLSGLLS